MPGESTPLLDGRLLGSRSRRELTFEAAARVSVVGRSRLQATVRERDRGVPDRHFAAAPVRPEALQEEDVVGVRLLRGCADLHRTRTPIRTTSRGLWCATCAGFRSPVSEQLTFELLFESRGSFSSPSP